MPRKEIPRKVFIFPLMHLFSNEFVDFKTMLSKWYLGNFYSE